MTSGFDRDFLDDPSPFESVLKFVMEFIQELHKENRPLDKMLEVSQQRFSSLTLGEPQNSKVIFFIFVFLYLSENILCYFSQYGFSRC